MLNKLNTFIKSESSPRETVSTIKRTIVDPSRIEGHTHNFYKYPACYPPAFVSSVIGSFSAPGDTIYDPFMGGGTSIVEGLIMGRNMIGTDINDLAVFSTKLKTISLDHSDITALDRLMSNVLLLGASGKRFSPSKGEEEFFRELPADITSVLCMTKELIDELPSKASQMFATGWLLRVAKWAIDGTKSIPTGKKFIEMLASCFQEMVDEAIVFSARIKQTRAHYNLKSMPVKNLLKADLAKEGALRKFITNKVRASLIVTSPPYPGKHVLYNRWQVLGRRESSIPYWIIGSDQLKSPSFYTFGYRKSHVGIENYFRSIRASFINASEILKKNALVVQMVAFGNKKNQLEPFLDAMDSAGYSELKNLSRSSYDGRLWRSVPNRKWYNNHNKSHLKACQEVVFFHRKR